MDTTIRDKERALRKHRPIHRHYQDFAATLADSIDVTTPLELWVAYTLFALIPVVHVRLYGADFKTTCGHQTGMSLILDIRYTVFDLGLVALVYSTPDSGNIVVPIPTHMDDSGRMETTSTGGTKDLRVYLSKDRCSRCTECPRFEEIRIQNNVTIVEGSLEDDFAPTQRINVWRARTRAWDAQTWGHIQLNFHGEDDESMASPVWSFPNLRVLSGIGTTTVIFATPSREKYLEIRKRCVAPERSEILFLIRIETASSNAEVNFLATVIVTLLPANAFHPSGSSMISMCHPSILFPLNPLKDFPSFRHGSAGRATPSSIMPALPRDDVTHSGGFVLDCDRPSDSFSTLRLNGPAFLHQIDGYVHMMPNWLFSQDSRHTRSTGGEEDLCHFTAYDHPTSSTYSSQPPQNLTDAHDTNQVKTTGDNLKQGRHQASCRFFIGPTELVLHVLIPPENILLYTSPGLSPSQPHRVWAQGSGSQSEEPESSKAEPKLRKPGRAGPFTESPKCASFASNTQTKRHYHYYP
ncbi:uncharacterized protein ARMOST_00961 [Armillaria ostoyae]|uniref:Uncharacterized protein n=1 Tax=Armillaria ostoyae TaxID=47428 RepID=A0A284QMQ1_ARMOS|nr:uncharacterized protein ARMOST_00961 [Armillaria ostoyae]